jgi:hypothetical protein
MDNTIIKKYYNTVEKYYPSMNILQLGMVVIMLGVIRAHMGHENVVGTIDNYIHKSYLSDDVKQCVDFLERELLAIKKSKIDIDFWKRGNAGEFRRDDDKVENTLIEA